MIISEQKNVSYLWYYTDSTRIGREEPQEHWVNWNLHRGSSSSSSHKIIHHNNKHVQITHPKTTVHSINVLQEWYLWNICDLTKLYTIWTIYNMGNLLRFIHFQYKSIPYRLTANPHVMNPLPWTSKSDRVPEWASSTCSDRSDTGSLIVIWKSPTILNIANTQTLHVYWKLYSIKTFSLTFPLVSAAQT